MSLQLVAFLLAAAVLAAFAVSRVVRVGRGLEARPYGTRMWALALLVLVGPPVAVILFAGAVPAKGQAPIVEFTLVYYVSLALLATLMGIGAMLVRRFVVGNSRPQLLLALVGREPSAADVPLDPPMTEAIRESVARVDSANAAFPRGWAFMQQTDLPGFESAWTALDEATSGLEGLIADGVRLGTGVARQATDSAGDARNRLDTLHRAAAARGQAWAT